MLQHFYRDTIAAGHGIVPEWFGAMDQGFMVVRGKEEAAMFLVFEMFQQGVAQFGGKAKQLTVPVCL